MITMMLIMGGPGSGGGGGQWVAAELCCIAVDGSGACEWNPFKPKWGGGTGMVTERMLSKKMVYIYYSVRTFCGSLRKWNRMYKM